MLQSHATPTSIYPSLASQARFWRGEPNFSLPYLCTIQALSLCRRIRNEVGSLLEASLYELAPELAAAGLPVGKATLLAAEATRYGAIYWLTPSVARRSLLDGACQDPALVNAWGAWFDQTDTLHRLWHRVVAGFFAEPSRHCLVVDRYVPHGGFQALGPNSLCALTGDLADISSGDHTRSAIFDLHDFAHYAAGSLCAELYGNKLHSGNFARLPDQLVDLVAGFDSARVPQHSDGVMFGEILGHLFNERYDGNEPERVVEGQLARELLPYLLGRGSSYVPSVRRRVTPSRTITIWELAVLAQNKAYEAPASELEQLIFTRGGADGLDDLEALSPMERVRKIAGLRGRTFHEARNTLKHRAVALAYQHAVEELSRDADLDAVERELADTVMRNLRYDDYWDGLRRNLFEEIDRRLTATGRDLLGTYPELGGEGR